MTETPGTAETPKFVSSGKHCGIYRYIGKLDQMLVESPAHRAPKTVEEEIKRETLIFSMMTIL